jgi:hypothetical protein
MNYYGNQSALWIGEIDTVEDADINSIELIYDKMQRCCTVHK